MSDLPVTADPHRPLGGQRHRRSRNPDAVTGLRARLLRIVLCTAVVIALIAAAATEVLLRVRPPAEAVGWVTGTAVTLFAGVLLLAVDRVNAVVRAVKDQTATERAAAQTALAEAGERSQREIDEGVSQIGGLLHEAAKSMVRSAEQIRRGEPVSEILRFVPGDGRHALAALEFVVSDVVQAAAGVTASAAVAGAGQSMGAVLPLARRLQPLIQRAFDSLDALEKTVEDPVFLNSLFQLDHLMTQARRQVEGIALLGGATARQSRQPVLVYGAIRLALSEIPQFGRVTVYNRLEVKIAAHAVTDVSHLLAELIENATMFSPPHTKVDVRADMVPAGLRIEIDDVGLPMPSEVSRQMNHLLQTTDPIDVAAQLKDGRIGLVVVATIARRHKIPVRLLTNQLGGNRAQVLVPHALIHSAPDDRPVTRRDTSPVRPLAARPGAPVTSVTAGVRRSPGIASGPAGQAPQQLLPAQATAAGEGAEQSEHTDPSALPSGQSADEDAPPLPRRRAGYMAAELRHTPQQAKASAAPAGTHTASLLADVLQGRAQADSEPSPPPPPAVT